MPSREWRQIARGSSHDGTVAVCTNRTSVADGRAAGSRPNSRQRCEESARAARLSGAQPPHVPKRQPRGRYAMHLSPSPRSHGRVRLLDGRRIANGPRRVNLPRSRPLLGPQLPDDLTPSASDAMRTEVRGKEAVGRYRFDIRLPETGSTRPRFAVTSSFAAILRRRKAAGTSAEDAVPSRAASHHARRDSGVQHQQRHGPL